MCMSTHAPNTGISLHNLKKKIYIFNRDFIRQLDETNARGRASMCRQMDGIPDYKFDLNIPSRQCITLDTGINTDDHQLRIKRKSTTKIEFA